MSFNVDGKQMGFREIVRDIASGADWTRSTGEGLGDRIIEGSITGVLGVLAAPFKGESSVERVGPPTAQDRAAGKGMHTY